MYIPQDYPFGPPTIVFNPPLYHPMVAQGGENVGHTCFEMLAPATYKPTTSVHDSKYQSYNSNGPADEICSQP